MVFRGAQELVVAIQVGERHLDLSRAGHFELRRRCRARRRLDRGERPRPLDDGLGACQMLANTCVDCFAHAGQGMLAQELQYPHVPSCAGHRAVEFFQRGAEVGEACRQRPVAEHRRMVERARLAAQRREIVDRVEDQRLLLVTACVRRDGPPFRKSTTRST